MQWSRPELVVLMRRTPDEVVLGTGCRQSGYSASRNNCMLLKGCRH